VRARLTMNNQVTLSAVMACLKALIVLAVHGLDGRWLAIISANLNGETRAHLTAICSQLPGSLQRPHAWSLSARFAKEDGGYVILDTSAKGEAHDQACLAPAAVASTERADPLLI
jgi:hypothetical protein